MRDLVSLFEDKRTVRRGLRLIFKQHAPAKVRRYKTLNVEWETNGVNPSDDHSTAEENKPREKK